MRPNAILWSTKNEWEVSPFHGMLNAQYLDELLVDCLVYNAEAAEQRRNMETLGVEPYMFEPESEEESDVEEQPVTHRLEMTSEW